MAGNTSQHDEVLAESCARRLGCRRFSEDAAVDNAAKIQALITEWGKPSPSFPGALEASNGLAHMGCNLPGGYFRAGSRVVVPRRFGGSILGRSGIGDLRGYTDAASGSWDLALTRWGYDGAAVADSPIFDIGSHGTELSGLIIQGYHAALQADIWAASANYQKIGVLVRTDPNAFGGGLHGTALGIHACITGLQLGETTTYPDGNHADFLNYGWLDFNNCQYGLVANTIQSVCNSVQTITAHGGTDAVHMRLGGQWDIGTIYQGGGPIILGSPVFAPGAVLRIGDASGQWSPNANKIHVGTLTLDGSATGHKAIEFAGPGDGKVIIDTLHMPFMFTTTPMIIMRGGWHLIINGGSYLRNGMIRFEAPLASQPDYRNKVTLNNVMGLDTQSPTQLVDPTSPGDGTVEIRGYRHQKNPDSFGGWSSYNADQKWTAGTLTSTRTLSFV